MLGKIRSGRPPKGLQSLVDLVEQAIRDGHTTTPEIAKVTEIKQPTPYLVRLEKRGIIRKHRAITIMGTNRIGRAVNQHGWEWEIVPREER
jgi:hypothetical protein